jgi:hypothetical protein
MCNFFSSFKSNFLTVCLSALIFVLFFSIEVTAQDEAALIDTVNAEDAVFESTTAGEFTPGKGFTVFKSGMASLNLSVYGLARYINQIDEDKKYIDHLGRERAIDTRQDIMWHRTFLWASGHFFTPKLRYTISVWGLVSTDQVLVFGNLQYSLMKEIRLGVGVGPNLGSRSMQGPWPYLLSSDRLMAEEFFRPGFTSGVWMTGEVLPKFFYNVMLGNNLSQLGTTVSQLTRDLSTSASIWWMPTTGEFGPRGGYGDFEMHEEVATRFGASYTHMRDDRQTPDNVSSPNNTQVKMSDGLLFYETGALAQDVTVKKANFDVLAIDAGVKHNGWHLQAEYYFRYLSKFDAIGPVQELSSMPTSLSDNGFYALVSYEAIPKALQVYTATSYIFDGFKRNPWELVGGMSFYPSGTRSWRLNLHAIYMENSAASGSFGFYLAGIKGMSLVLGTDFLL